MREHPGRAGPGYPLSQWVYGAFAASIVVGMLWSFGSRFVPSPEGLEVSLGFSVLVAALAGLFGWKSSVFRTADGSSASWASRSPVLATPQTRIPALVVGALLFTFTATERGFLDWWTEISGVPGERLVHLSSYSVSNRPQCAGFDVAEAPIPTGRAVCADLGHYPGPPPGTPVRLFGRTSPFGLIVDRYQVEAAGQ
jgi:hypothetical protein